MFQWQLFCDRLTTFSSYWLKRNRTRSTEECENKVCRQCWDQMNYEFVRQSLTTLLPVKVCCLRSATTYH